MSEDDVLAVEGRIPWREPADLARFRRLTLRTTVIMGRRTWLALPQRPLPDRHNIVITSESLPGVQCHRHLDEALAASAGRVWIIGGAELYAAAYRWADHIDLTRVPIRIDRPDALLMPPIPSRWFVRTQVKPLDEDPRLRIETYRRRAP